MCVCTCVCESERVSLGMGGSAYRNSKAVICFENEWWNQPQIAPRIEKSYPGGKTEKVVSDKGQYHKKMHHQVIKLRLN